MRQADNQSIVQLFSNQVILVNQKQMNEFGGAFPLKAKPLPSITESLITKYRSKSSAQEDDHEKDELKNSPVDEEQGTLAFAVGLAKSALASVAGKFGFSSYSYEHFTKQEMIDNLLLQKKTAISYSKWMEVCNDLDELQDFNKWKQETESNLYDFSIVKKNMMELRSARLDGDIRKLLYLIRTTWTRNIGNIGNVNLYRHSHTGTKK